MQTQPEPRTPLEAHLAAVERDTALIERLGTVLGIVDRLIDRVGELERQLSDERIARERLELRVNAQWLRDRGYTLTSDDVLYDASDDLAATASRNVVPLIRDYAPDTEPIPTTDDPTSGGDTDA